MNDAAPQMRVRFDVEFSNGRTGHKRLRERRPKTKNEAPPPPSRLARLLALAHHFDDMVSEGVVKDQAEVARLMKVTRARVTQVMSLLYLAPDIQEEVLLSTAVAGDSSRLSERWLRALALTDDWQRQRRIWTGRTSGQPRCSLAKLPLPLPSTGPVQGSRNRPKNHKPCS